jgi:hypothetical protein
MIRPQLKLLVLYLGCFLGFGALAFQSIFFAVDLYTFGPRGVSGFYLGWFLLSGLLLFPLFTWCKKSHPSFFLLLILATGGLGLFGAWQTMGSGLSPYLIGIQNALIVTGFFQLYHLVIAGVTTSEGRTKELAIVKITSQIGGILGASLGGLVGQQYAFGESFLGSALVFGIGTVALAVISPRVKSADYSSVRAPGEVHSEPLLDVILGYPRQNCGVVLDAFLHTSANFLLPIVLLVRGFSPQSVGFLYATRLTATLLLAPLMHRSIANGEGREFVLGSFLGCSGWLILIFASPHIFSFLIATTLLSCALFLTSIGLETRWYARRSMTQILARELILTAARLVAVPLLSFAAFRAPNIYLACGFISAALIYPYGRWLLACNREGGLERSGDGI